MTKPKIIETCGGRREPVDVRLPLRLAAALVTALVLGVIVLSPETPLFFRLVFFAFAVIFGAAAVVPDGRFRGVFARRVFGDLLPPSGGRD